MIKVFTPPQNEFAIEQFLNYDNTYEQLYDVYINNKKIDLFAARVSAMPFNTWWPGHQRPLNQTEISSFLSIEADEAIDIEIVPKKEFNEVAIRPLSKKINHKIENGKIIARFENAGQYTVEPFGRHNALHIFINPPKTYEITPAGEDVIYFGAGVHNIGLIEMKSNQTLYIDENAVVYGHIHAIDADNIRILGRGILDSSKLIEDPSKELDPELFDDIVHDAERDGTLVFEYCTNLYIEGITIRDPLFLCLRPIACENVKIDNVKIIGCWRYNADGIDFINTKNALVSNCFVRSFDDSLCVKGFYFLHQGMLFHNRKAYDVADNIYFKNCVVWNDWGHALEIGIDLCAREIKNCGFEDCDIIHGTGEMLDVMNCDYAEVYNITYKNIRIEYEKIMQKPTIQTKENPTFIEDKNSDFYPTLLNVAVIYYKDVSKSGLYRGKIHDITFENIAVTAAKIPPSIISGYDAEHKVANVIIKDFYLNGEKITDFNKSGIEVKEFTESIELI